MKNNIDFATITVCGLCEVFPYEWIIQKVVGEQISLKN